MPLGDSDSGGEPVTKRSSGSRFDDMIDPSSTPEERRRQRRMLSNRESARRSRRRKENFLQVRPPPSLDHYDIWQIPLILLIKEEW